MRTTHARAKIPRLLRASDSSQPFEAQKTVEKIAIGRVKPNPANAHTHSERQIELIARSIEHFGFVNPILIDRSGMIIAGQGRFEASRRLGLSTVPVLRIEHLDESAIRAYMLADNKLAELAGWDPQILSIELQGLLDIGYDLDLTGFAPAEIDLLFEAVADTNDSTSPDDAVPDRIETNVVSRPGDMWLLGDHRVQCADARDQAAYRRLLGNKKADLVFADAPYNVHITGHVGGLGTIKHREFAMASGEMSDAAYAAFLSKTFGNAVQASRDGAVQFWCMDWRHTMPLQLAAREANAKHLNVCIWVKNNGGMGSLYRSQHELVFVFKVGTAPHINNVELGKHGRNRTNVWNYPGVNTFRAGRLEELAMHPTVKPVALVADAIKDVSKRGNLVLDPFAGSGTTVISAEKTGRRAFCIEIDPVYVDVAVRRWQEFTGRRAVLAGTQASFDERAGEIVQLKRDKTDGKAKP